MRWIIEWPLLLVLCTVFALWLKDLAKCMAILGCTVGILLSFVFPGLMYAAATGEIAAASSEQHNNNTKAHYHHQHHQHHHRYGRKLRDCANVLGL
mmetsp:Transcript_13922/g.19507  ORF Transcript_13922/g.19507 Transcript_13922/m.19507 type:complete len:96 (-) Transcript_13922:348-635(-)